MKNMSSKGAFLPADEDIVEQFFAFLLRCADTKPKYDNARLMSEITAKRLLQGLKRSGFVLMKKSAEDNPSPPGPQNNQRYLL